MREKRIADALGNVDEAYIAEAAPGRRPRKRQRFPLWAAAACLCLIAVTAFAVSRIAGDGTQPGGGMSAGSGSGSGMDAGSGIGGEAGIGAEGNYSVAVFPREESLENVASAVVESLPEERIPDSSLAAHLPSELPEGFHFGQGHLYSTVMKDGTEYFMLRVEYITGEYPELQHTGDGGVLAPDLEEMGKTLTVAVWNYDPGTGETVFSSPEEVSPSALEDAGRALVRAGDCVVAVFMETADAADALEALRAVS